DRAVGPVRSGAVPGVRAAGGRVAEDLNTRWGSAVAGTGARTTTVILDGDDLARRRAPILTRRAQDIAGRRGQAPRVALTAVADEEGSAAYSGRKLRACAAAGVEVRPLIVPFGSGTGDALAAMRRLLVEERVDAVFLEFPSPPGVDGDTLIDAIPAALDVD